MKIKTVTKTIHSVNLGDFERFIEEYLGYENGAFCLAEEENLSNGCIATYFVDGKVGEPKEVIKAKKRKSWKSYACEISDVLNAANKEGLIPSGEYQVDVSW